MWILLLNSVLVINACLLFPPLLSAATQSFFSFQSLLSLFSGNSNITKYHDSLFSTEIIMCDITSRDMTKHHPIILNLHVYTFDTSHRSSYYNWRWQLSSAAEFAIFLDNFGKEKCFWILVNIYIWLAFAQCRTRQYKMYITPSLMLSNLCAGMISQNVPKYPMVFRLHKFWRLSVSKKYELLPFACGNIWQ